MKPTMFNFKKVAGLVLAISMAACAELQPLLEVPKTDTLIDKMLSVEPKGGRTENVNYASGLAYTFTPALNTWTFISANDRIDNISSLGGIIKGRVYSNTNPVRELIAIVIAYEDGKDFSTSSTANVILVKQQNNNGTFSDAAILSRAISADRKNMFIVMNLTPGVKNLYPMLKVGNTYYHTRSIAVTATGWMVSGETVTQQNIIATARGLLNQSSGQSVIGGAGQWITDMATSVNSPNGDAPNWRNAINDFHNWRVSNPRLAVTQAIRNTISARLVSYIPSDRTLIVNRIIEIYNNRGINVNLANA